MTRDEIVARVHARLGKRSDLTSDIQAELTLIQQQLEKQAFLPWFLKQLSTSFACVAGTATLTLPSNFIRMGSKYLWLQDPDSGTWTRVQRARLQELEAISSPNDSNALPKFWEQVGSAIQLRPIPDKAYAGKAYCFVADAELSSTVPTNSWSTYAPDLLITRTGVVMAATYLINDKLAGLLQGFAKQAWDDLVQDTVAREEVERDESVDDLIFLESDDDD